MTVRDQSQIAQQAIDFYSLPELRAISSPDRLECVLSHIEHQGYYEHDEAELILGAKIAWRNHARCIGRYSWRSLTVLDARSCETADEIAQACWEHMLVSTNGGKVKPTVTIFRPRLNAERLVRIVNPQIIRYAGYRADDGRIIGDPLHVKLTEKIMRLGWKGSGGQFDILPLVICVDAKPPALFNIPAECVLEVPIKHPRYDWFEQLGLRWHANPAISNLCLEIGGIRYTAAPFTGWYVSSEIGARNLSDESRYNMLPVIAEKMGLDVRRNSSLWRDRALLELNEAVIFSYEQAGVYIVDHHTAARQFSAHIERETAVGRMVPADWIWLVPPISSSTSPLFHRGFDPPDPKTRPDFVKQDEIEFSMPEDLIPAIDLPLE